ncbi:MAG: gliding motility-associated C-terminal domain-containing protein, partial [Nonlabens sp.]
WSPALASGSGIFDPSLDAAGIYTYTVSNTTCASSASSQVTVGITPFPDAGTGANLDICDNDPVIDLFTLLGGIPDAGGTWIPALASGSGVFNPSVDSAGSYTYTVNSIAPCTTSATASVNVNIQTAPDAGANGALDLCSDTSPIDLFTALGGTPDAGGTWSPALASGSGVFDPSVDAQGIYTYTINVNSCGSSDFSSVDVTITDVINVFSATVILDDELCLGEDNLVIIDGLTNLADGFYDFEFNLIGPNNDNIVQTIEVSGGSASFTILSGVINLVGSYNLELIGISRASIPCGIQLTNLAFDDFEVIDVELIDLTTDGNVFCESDNATIADLTNNVITTLPVSWFDSAVGGNVVDANTTLINGATYYASVSNSIGCTTVNRLAVTVLVEACQDDLGIVIPDGFSPNGDGINDSFTIRNLRTLYPNFELRIYNRNGDILFTGKSWKEDWDGTKARGVSIGDGTVPAGVYFFVLDLNSNIKDIQGRFYLSN